MSDVGVCYALSNDHQVVVLYAMEHAEVKHE